MGRTRRAVAAFAVASLLWFPSSILAFQPGKARWPIKTGIPEGADLDHPKRVGLADFIDAAKLPDAPGVTKNDAQFQAARIPKFDNPLGVAEGDILSTVGWLHLVAAEADGDYHIQISTTTTRARTSSSSRCRHRRRNSLPIPPCMHRLRPCGV